MIFPQSRHTLSLEKFVSEMAATLDALPLIAYIVQREGEVVHVNRAWLEYTGLSLEASQGLEGAQVIHPQDVSRVLETYRSAVLSGSLYQCDYRLKNQAGRYFSFRGRAESLLDGAGEIVGWLGTATPLEGLTVQGTDFQGTDFQGPGMAPESSHWTAQSGATLPRVYRVLIVDDNPVDAEILVRALRQHLLGRVSFERVEYGEQMLLVLERNSFDCVLLDQQLPDITGLELLKQHRFPCAVIMLTGEGDERLAVQAMRSGAQDYLSKTAHPGPALAHALERAVERYALERELERQNGLNHAILHSFSDAFVSCDRTFRIQYLNAAFETLTGRSRAELLGKELWNVFPATVGTEMEGQCRHALESGEMQEFEYTLEETQQWYGVRAYPYAGGISVLLTNITDHKHTQRELERSERRYRGLVEASSHVVFTADANGQRDPASLRWWQEFTEQSAEDSVGSGCLEAIHPEDREKVSGLWTHAVEQVSPYEAEFRVQTRSGGVGWICARAVPMPGPVGLEWVGTLEDISEQKAGELALERTAVRMTELLELQKRFVSDASHELRAPLTAIRGNLELLRMYPTMNAQDRAEALEETEREAVRLGRLIADLLSLARGDGGVQLAQDALNLNKLLAEAYRSSQHLGGRHRIKFQLPESGGPADTADTVWVEGDRDRLMQLLLILLENAVRYTPEGGDIVLTLLLEEQQVGFRVQDSGIGIAPQDLPHIFERFYRTDRSRSVDTGGTGLGLSIARWIVEQHQGTLEVESQLERGTCFTARFPRWMGQE